MKYYYETANGNVGTISREKFWSLMRRKNAHCRVLVSNGQIVARRFVYAN